MAKQNEVTAESAIKAFKEAEYKIKNDNLRKMNEELRLTVEGHKELAKVFTAYIALLLKRVGATEEEPMLITEEDVKYALEHYETRAILQNGEKMLFCAEKV